MDTSIPLGIIINEPVSNALKHAFPAGTGKEIRIILSRAGEHEKRQKTEDSRTERNCPNDEDLQYSLVIEDNRRGFPGEIDFKNTNSLGLELVNILVEQTEGCIEHKRNGKPDSLYSSTIEDENLKGDEISLPI